MHIAESVFRAEITTCLLFCQYIVQINLKMLIFLRVNCDVVVHFEKFAPIRPKLTIE